MTGTAAAFTVLRTEWAPADPEVLAPILQEVLGLVRYDAVRQASQAQGIVAQHLDGAQAQALAERCTAAGMEATAVDEAALATVGVPVLVRTVRLDDAGLGVVLGYTGGERVFPWSALRLLSVGVIAETTGRAAAGGPRRRKKVGFGTRMALGALVGPLGGIITKGMERRMNERQKGERGPVRRSTVVEMADLFLEDPDGGDTVHLRLRGPDLYYPQILGEACAGDPEFDFRAVLLQVAERATGAAISDSTRALLLAGEDPEVDPADAVFEGPHQFAAYNVWQLQMELSGGGAAG
ncbi:MAG: hypothetical protein ACYTGX_03835 [Planctomycetota bacterium]|jgi:hypothetical protein